MTVYVGTSGFSYSGWKGQFYPKDLKSEDFLAYYAKQLNSVEINSSFYAAPSQQMVKSWFTKADDDRFRFAFKAPKQITHIMKLAGKPAAEASGTLDQTLSLLQARKGPLLFQLPPYLRQDLTLLEDFLRDTAEIPRRVFEFRHASWLADSTYNILDKYKASFCVAETEDMKPVLKVTGGMPYFRLRMESYDEKAIQDWSGKIEKLVRGMGESYVFLRHDATGTNASYALMLLQKLN